mgnify:CR=1 FL=1
MSKQVTLTNMEPRVFVGELENRPLDKVTAPRTTLDPQTGEGGTRLSTYTTYETLTLQHGEATEPLDDDVLRCASISGAVRSGWLRVTVVEPEPAPTPVSVEDEATQEKPTPELSDDSSEGIEVQA